MTEAAVRKPWLLNLFLGFLWMGLAKVAFTRFPAVPAMMVSAGLLAVLLVLFPFPTRKMLDEDFKRELGEGRKSWRDRDKLG